MRRDPSRSCQWCGRSAADGVLMPRTNECTACNRAAHRNGRDSTGRPIRLTQIGASQ